MHTVEFVIYLNQCKCDIMYLDDQQYPDYGLFLLVLIILDELPWFNTLHVMIIVHLVTQIRNNCAHIIVYRIRV